MTRKQPDSLGSSLKTDISLDRVTRTHPDNLVLLRRLQSVCELDANLNTQGESYA